MFVTGSCKTLAPAGPALVADYIRLMARLRPAVEAHRRLLSEVALGLAAATGGAAARLALDAPLGHALPFVTFFPAVALGAWGGGLVGGLVAIVASVGAALAMIGERAQPASANFVGAAVFVLGGIMTAWLGHGARHGRHEAEAARDRARFVAEASRLLHEPLDRAVTLDALARIVVPRFADWCAIDMFDADLRFTGAVIVAPDPRQRATAQEVRDAYPYRPDAPAGVAWVARTGSLEAVLDIPPEFFDLLPDERLRGLMRSLDFHSYISAPMVLPTGRTLGVLTVAMSSSGRRFDRDDVEVAADLARRTAVALDHADLLHEARARRDQLEAIVTAIPEAVLVADARGLIEVANRAAVELLGGVVRQPLVAVLETLEQVPGRDEVRRSPSGRYVSPLVLDAVVDAVPVQFAVLVDRTDVVETEAARDAFVGMLSHELRTPITTIYAGSQLLRRALPADSRAHLTEELALDAERLVHLVEDLLVLSRFERGRLDAALEPLLPGRVIEAAVAAEAGALPRLHVTVDADADLPVVLADATFVRQIVRNLLTNAAKYAGPDAAVRIGISGADGVLRASFHDDGPGIQPEGAERVFGLFERLPVRDHQPGAGIGLFVCRRLAEVMGGTLRLDPGCDGGACFVLELPALAPGDASDGVATETGASARG